MNLRIFIKIVACCACLYACNDRGQLILFPSDSDFNFDSSFYPKRIGAQWKYGGFERAESGLTNNPYPETWWYEKGKFWVWTLMKYEQINADSASILISAFSIATYTRSDSRYTNGPNGPLQISTFTRDTTIYRDTGTIGLSRYMITLEFKHDFLKPMYARWDGGIISGSKYERGPLIKRRGYYIPAGSALYNRFSSGAEFGQYEFIP